MYLHKYNMCEFRAKGVNFYAFKEATSSALRNHQKMLALQRNDKVVLTLKQLRKKRTSVTFVHDIVSTKEKALNWLKKIYSSTRSSNTI